MPPGAVGGEGEQRCPGGLKEGVVDKPGLMEGQLVEGVGQGEDHVEVGHGQELLLPGLDPLLPLSSLAFGAVAVATGVVAHAHLAAAGAGVHMPAHLLGAAAHDGRKVRSC
nr:hypothetical protein [Pontibacter korlensis]